LCIRSHNKRLVTELCLQTHPFNESAHMSQKSRWLSINSFYAGPLS
jgi:hypothetical protein